jgi:hypothetical protein
VCKLIVASAVLHNICVNKEIPLLEEDQQHCEERVIPQLAEERRQGNNVPETGRPAELARNQLLRNFEW